MGSFSSLTKLIEGNESFALVCHEDPDGDAIGSTLALKKFLKAQGKSVRILCSSEIPAVFQFLRGSDDVSGLSKLKEGETLIVLDCGDMRRTKMEDEIRACKKNGKKIINIDHHPKNDLWRIVDANYVDDSASSTCEIVYRIAVGLNWQISSDIATDLLCGIYTDTGGFQHSNTSTQVMKIVSELLCLGARLTKISENISNERSVAKLKLWGMAMDRIKINQELGIAYSVLKLKDIRSAGANEEDISGLINLLNAVPESRATLLIYESENGKIKGSLRTDRDDVDLSKLASELGGGGHKKAAGFTIEGEILSENDARWSVK